MIPGVIAKRYATAILELGSETGKLDEVVEEFGRVAQAYEASRELRAVFDDPLVSAAAKKAILAEVVARLDLSATTKSAVGILLDRRRIRAVPAIAARLREMADLKRGIIRAEVHTAMPLPEDYFVQLQEQLERITGRRVALERKLDPTLICGVVARVGDTVYDGSIIARLRQMKDSMLPN